MINHLIPAVSGTLVALLAGGLARGLDRRLTARLQSRIGPPVLQPFYDVAKLFLKEKLVVSVWQELCAYMFLASAVVSVLLFFLQSDLLLILFVHGVSSFFLITGALSVCSPYSQIGAHRELMQTLTSKTFLVFVCIGMYLQTGSFRISTVYSLDHPLLFKLPLLFLVLACAVMIELRKSPFDFAASHHAHQEIVGGVLTEFSGPCLAAIEIGHWYEIVLLFGLCSLFWATSGTGMMALTLFAFAVHILIDNLSARLTWRWMIGLTWGAGVALSVLNLIRLYEI